MNQEIKVINPFKPYKNIHLNESAVFFGSGPTLLEYDLSKIPSDFLRFGINDQFFLDEIDLDYWFMGDSHKQELGYFFERFEEYNNYKPKRGKFIRSSNWSKETFKLYKGIKMHKNGQLPPDMNYAQYYTCNNVPNSNACCFNEDLGEGHLTSVASITFEVLQFILYTGVKNIFLVGHDCEYSQGDYNKSTIGKKLNAGHWISRYWKIVAAWIEKKKPDVKIFWVNPKGTHLFNCLTTQQSYDRMISISKEQIA